MQKMTTKAYAIKNKLSLFQVIKKVKSGELKSEVIEANGKEITYILADETPKAESKKKTPLTETQMVWLHLFILIFYLRIFKSLSMNKCSHTIETYIQYLAKGRDFIFLYRATP